MTTIKAFQVHDGDEQTVIVFEKSHVAARRVGANQMNIDFEDVDYCKRMPEFDGYAPGPVPKLELIAAGWWCECYGCNRRIDDDTEDDDGAPLTPVEAGDAIYCSVACQERYLADKAARKAIEAFAIKTMIDDVLRRWPEAVIGRTHAYARDQVQCQQCIVEFQFPGSKYRATWRVDDGGMPQLYVANGDKAAWDAYVAKVRA